MSAEVGLPQFDGVIWEVDGRGVATVTIDRADKLNAIDGAVMDGLVALFERFHQDPAIRAVVLTGKGTRGFCAGRDLVDAGDGDTGGAELRMRGHGRNMFEAILECGKPTVAAVFGYTLGGGAELALACDVRIAGSTLSMGFPEARVGLGANFGSVMLPRVVPLGIAYDLLYTARRVDADEALRIGLVNRVVPSEELASAASEYAGLLAGNAPVTLQRYKAMIGKGLSLPVAAALRLDASPNPYVSNDRREGVAAWRDRREPNWTGT